MNSIAGNHEVILEVCNPEVFALNPFRVLGVPIDATDREIKKVADRIQIELKLTQAADGPPATDPGVNQDINPPHMESGAPRLEAVRDAMQRIRDPHRRIVEAFFWYWPLRRGRTASDVGLQALAEGDLTKASGFWEQHLGNGREGGIALHNLAVLRHQLALQQEESLTDPEGASPSAAERDRTWESAFSCWNQLFAHEAFWSATADLIRALDDPRVATAFGQTIRETLPLGLLSIGARFALRASEGTVVGVAERRLKLMELSAFGGELILQARLAALEPVRDRLKILVQQAETEVETDAIHGDATAQRLLKDTGPLLATVDRFLPEGHATRNGLHDEVAGQALSAIKGYANRTEDYETSLKILLDCAGIALSASTSSQIEATAARFKEASKNDFRWRGPGYYQLPADVVQGLESAREKFFNEDLAGAIQTLLDLIERHRSLLEPDQGRLVEKPLALCLTARASKTMDEAFSELALPPTVLKRASLRPDFERNMSRSGLVCGACGNFLTGQVFTFTYKDTRVTLCSSCGEAANNEHEQMRARVRSSYRAAGIDLLRASQLDPSNSTIKGRVAQHREIAPKLNVAMPRISDVPARAIWGTSAERAQLAKDGATSGATRAPMPGATPGPRKMQDSLWVVFALGGGFMFLLCVILIAVAINPPATTPAVATQKVYVTATFTPSRTPTPTQPNTPTPGPMAIINVSNANVRSGPGKTYGPVGAVKLGESVQVQGVSPDREWLLVLLSQKGESGWVWSAAVDLRDSAIASIATVVYVTATPTPKAPTPTRTPSKTPTGTPTRKPTSTRRPTSTPAPRITVTVQIANQLQSTIYLRMSGPVNIWISVPAGSTRDIHLAAGTYYYWMTAEGCKPYLGTETYYSGQKANLTWLICPKD